SRQMAAHLPLPIPDLRFEQSFLKSVRQHYRVVSAPEEKTESKALALQIEWPSIAWITLKSQVLSPFVQGAVLAILGTFFEPARALLPSMQRLRLQPEGGMVRWLRTWVKSVGVTSGVRNPN
ncbi:unnamed protein product, partial [Mycena citricolor]